MRIARWVAGIVFVVLAFAGYVIVSLVSTSQPSVRPFPGWIALFASETSSADEAHLNVAPEAVGAPGEHPAVIIDVAVCGTQPFHGVLVMSGAARPLDPVGVQPTVVGQSGLAGKPI